MEIVKTTVLTALIFFASLFLIGCGNSDGSDSDGENGGDVTALVERGEEVTANNCLGCHAIEEEGLPLVGSGEKYTKEELIELLVDGIGNMPGGTADGEEEAVAEYLLTLD